MGENPAGTPQSRVEQYGARIIIPLLLFIGGIVCGLIGIVYTDMKSDIKDLETSDQSEQSALIDLTTRVTAIEASRVRPEDIIRLRRDIDDDVQRASESIESLIRAEMAELKVEIIERENDK